MAPAPAPGPRPTSKPAPPDPGDYDRAVTEAPQTVTASIPGPLRAAVQERVALLVEQRDPATACAEGDADASGDRRARPRWPTASAG